MATGHKVRPLAAAPVKRQAALSGKVLSCVCSRESSKVPQVEVSRPHPLDGNVNVHSGRVADSIVGDCGKVLDCDILHEHVGDRGRILIHNDATAFDELIAEGGVGSSDGDKGNNGNGNHNEQPVQDEEEKESSGRHVSGLGFTFSSKCIGI